jgi:hypothetical protein
MNPEIKQKWTDALRSGDYKQGRACLRSIDDRYCCLGVLCDVIGLEWHLNNNHKTFFTISFDSQDWDAYLPETLCNLLNLKRKDREDLMNMNDGVGGSTPKSFEQIANYIEENL